MTQTLPTAVLGRTGLEVSRLGYGTALRNQPNHEQWGRLLNAVLDSGINFIDTANDYGVRSASGPAEEQIGRHISARRSDYRLATKCGCGPDGHIWTRENAFRGLHESLERLKTDYVDIMQYHNPTLDWGVFDTFQGTSNLDHLQENIRSLRRRGSLEEGETRTTFELHAGPPILLR